MLKPGIEARTSFIVGVFTLGTDDDDEDSSSTGCGGNGLTIILGTVDGLPEAIVVFFFLRFACCRSACLMIFLL